MGSGMAGRLLSASFPLTLYNRNAEKAATFVASGAFLANSPREAASRSEIVISMVADDAASRGVWLGENGALAGARPGSVLVECGTLTSAWVRELAALAAKHQCELLDAPVTGTKPHAASGQLLFLVGGSDKALDAARPVLAVLGRDVIHFGPTGSGALMKLVNNFMCGVQAASLAEAVALVEAGGLDREKALSVLSNGAPGSPLVKTLLERIKSDGPPNFLLHLMAKDLGYAVEEASHHHIALKTASSALEVFQQAIAAGRSEKDFSAVIGTVSPPSHAPREATQHD